MLLRRLAIPVHRWNDATRIYCEYMAMMTDRIAAAVGTVTVGTIGRMAASVVADSKRFDRARNKGRQMCWLRQLPTATLSQRKVE